MFSIKGDMLSWKEKAIQNGIFTKRVLLIDCRCDPQPVQNVPIP